MTSDRCPENPGISAIITTYNRAEMVVEAINSVLAQTRQADEIIVVDDGSTDQTPLTLSQFSGLIRYFRFANGGISSARNRGIGLARYELIAFLDSDDLWLPDKLARQEEYMRQNCHCLISYTGEIWLRANTRINQGNRHRKPDGWIFEPSLQLCLVSPSSVMIRRQLFQTIGLFDESLPVCEDYDFWLRVAHRFPFHFIDVPLIVKRGRHAGQLSHKYPTMDRFRIIVLQKLLCQSDLSVEQRKQVLQVIIRKSSIIAAGCHIRNKHEDENYFSAIKQSAIVELATL